ncbi:hypothetical protein K443DRAFT_672638 [Laccaria amethystina LaAM-08-1]|uniref:Carbohydrate-binding module family 19 domain-containing protein n=1 Tax=Laccaria amethystina LaAM-08-1 TaxID=1095629 RepID=A0A0C9YCR9_9AGAR|nr:hypothetical protein K443DRAFT_672638 [Laccaria amethystina LaAM-08-1]
MSSLLSLISLLSLLAAVYSAPAQLSYDQLTPSPAAAPDFLKQNGLDAQKLNSQFASMKPTDSCQDGQMACVTSAFAQCVGGKWSLSTCSSGLACYALPLVNKPGTSLVCDTPMDAAARFAATGVDGGVTGTVPPAQGNNSTSAPTPSGVDDPVDDDCDDDTSSTDDGDGDDCDEGTPVAGAPQIPDDHCGDDDTTSSVPLTTPRTVKSASQSRTVTSASSTPTIANQANEPAPTTIYLTSQSSASTTPSVILLNRRQAPSTLPTPPPATTTALTSSAPISTSSSSPAIVTPTVVIGTDGIVTVTVVSTVFVSASCGLPSVSATLSSAPSAITVSSAIPPAVTLTSPAITSSSASSASITATPSATGVISLSVPPVASDTSINGSAGGGLTFISQVATPPAVPSPTGSFNLSELLTATVAS